MVQKYNPVLSKIDKNTRKITIQKKIMGWTWPKKKLGRDQPKTKLGQNQPKNSWLLCCAQ